MIGWNEFQEQKKQYAKIWEDLKQEFTGDIRKFLDESYLVICYGYNESRQINFGAGLFDIALHASDFLIDNETSRNLICLAMERKETRNSFQGVSVESLYVVDYQTEVRFPTVRIDFIELVKRSQYCVNTRADMSIRPVLKK